MQLGHVVGENSGLFTQRENHHSNKGRPFSWRTPPLFAAKHRDQDTCDWERSGDNSAGAVEEWWMRGRLFTVLPDSRESATERVEWASVLHDGRARKHRASTGFPDDLP